MEGERRGSHGGGRHTRAGGGGTQPRRRDAPQPHSLPLSHTHTLPVKRRRKRRRREGNSWRGRCHTAKAPQPPACLPPTHGRARLIHRAVSLLHTHDMEPRCCVSCVCHGRLPLTYHTTPLTQHGAPVLCMCVPCLPVPLLPPYFPHSVWSPTAMYVCAMPACPSPTTLVPSLGIEPHC